MLAFLSFTGLTSEEYKKAQQNIKNRENYINDRARRTVLRFDKTAEYVCFSSSVGDIESQVFYLRSTKKLIHKHIQIAKGMQLLLRPMHGDQILVIQ